MKASIVIVGHAGIGRLGDSLGPLDDPSVRGDAEVVLVDNGSADRCGDAATHRWPWLRSVRSEANLGFAGGVNLGAETATGEVLILLNDDAAVEPGFVDGHLSTLAANPRAAATGGRLVSWDRRSHDFVRGVVTFDSHAFQIGQGWPVGEIDPPAAGEPLAFPCGGNMAIRRAAWDEVEGFDADLFAYFEDVELGWRLWALGHEVVAAPDAVARHRGGATSSGLGDFRRGVLFERNALRTFFACADDEHRAAVGPAVFATFARRVAAFAAQEPELTPLAADPFGRTPAAADRGERWRRRIRERGLLGALRHLGARAIGGPRVGAPGIGDGHLLMQLRAADGFFGGIEASERRRRELAARRRRTDREILSRFPRLVVPTYPGDEEWFASEAFSGLLPDEWPIERRPLDEVLHPGILPG